MFRSTPTKKAKKKGRKAIKRAKATGGAMQERAAEFTERAGSAAQDAATGIAGRLRDSEALAKAQEIGSDYAERARDRWRDAELDERLSDLGERIRDTEVAQRTYDRTKAMTDSSLAALGAWLTTSDAGKRVSGRLGLQPKRRWPFLVALLFGLGAGYALARLGGGGRMREEYVEVGEEIRAQAVEAADRAAEHSERPATSLLVDSIRTSLHSDPRTAQVSELDINVAEGTVFVRGRVPPEIDEDAIRDVITAVPGVEDVDLQLTPA